MYKLSCKSRNPLGLTISMYILHTVLLTFSLVLSLGHDQELLQLPIIFPILITFTFDSSVILEGEIRWVWSLLWLRISSTINLCDSGMNGGSLSGATVQSHVIVESKTVLQNAKVSWVKCWLTPHFVQRINLKSNKYVTMIRVLQSGLREIGQRWVITFVT